MTETFGITYTLFNRGVGTPVVKDTGMTSLEYALSVAGREIHKPFIRSVCAYAREGKNAGKVALYLLKDKEGHVIKREYNPELC